MKGGGSLLLSPTAQRAFESYQHSPRHAGQPRAPFHFNLHSHPKPPSAPDPAARAARSKSLKKVGWLSSVSSVRGLAGRGSQARVAPEPAGRLASGSRSSTANSPLEHAAVPAPQSCDVDYIHSAMSPITGCFEPELEARFRDYYDESYGDNVKRAVLIGVFLWLGLGTLHDLDIALITDNDIHELEVLVAVRLSGFVVAILNVLLFRWLPVDRVVRAAPWLSMTGTHCLALTTLVLFSALESATTFWLNSTLEPAYVLLLILLPSLSATMLRNAHVVTSAYSGLLLLLFLILTLITDRYDVPYLITVTLSILVVHGLYTLHSYRENLRTRHEFLQFCHLQQEQELHQRLLQKMLPLSIITKLRAGAEYVYEKYDNVSVLFSHIHDFDLHTASTQPLELVRTLNKIFSMFDQLTDEHKVYKVETIGDVFLVCSGCPAEYARNDHAAALCVLAVDMMAVVKAIKLLHDAARRNSLYHSKGSSHSLLVTHSSGGEEQRVGPPAPVAPFTASHSRLELRIGVNTGPVIAGVVGVKYPRYRLMGDTINTASRMSTTCDAGEIQLASTTFAELNAADFICEKRTVEVKGKGSMQTHILHEHLLPHRSSATRVQKQQPAATTRGDSPTLRAGSGSFSHARSPVANPQTTRGPGEKAAVDAISVTSTNSPSHNRLGDGVSVLTPFNAQEQLEATIRAKSAQVAHLVPSSHRMSVSTAGTSEQYGAHGDKADEGPATERELPQVHSEPVSQIRNDSGVDTERDAERRPASAPMSPVLTLTADMHHASMDLQAMAPLDSARLQEHNNAARTASTTEKAAESSMSASVPRSLSSLVPPSTQPLASTNPSPESSGTLPAGVFIADSASSSDSHSPSPAPRSIPSPMVTTPSPPRPRPVPLASFANGFRRQLRSASVVGFQEQRYSVTDPSGPLSNRRLSHLREQAASITDFPGTPSSLGRGHGADADPSPEGSPRETLVHSDHTVTLLRAYTAGRTTASTTPITAGRTRSIAEASQSHLHQSEDLTDSPVSVLHHAFKRSSGDSVPEKSTSALAAAGMQVTPRTELRILVPSPSGFGRAATVRAASFNYGGQQGQVAPSSRARMSTSYLSPPPVPSSAADGTLPSIIQAITSLPGQERALPVVLGSSSRTTGRRQRDVVITAHSDRVKTAKMFTYGNADVLLHLPRPLWNRLSQTFYTAPDLEDEFQAGKADREGGTARWWLLLLMASLLPCAVWETVAVEMADGLSAAAMTGVWVLRVAAVAMCCACYRVVGDAKLRSGRPMMVFATCVVLTFEFIVANVVEGTFQTLYGLCVLLFTFSVTTMFLALPIQLCALYTLLSIVCWVVTSLIAWQRVDPIILVHFSACLLYLGSSYSAEYRDRLSFIRFLRHANEKTTTENFLANLLPKQIIDSLTVSKQPFIAHERACADVLFCDVVQFTALAARSSPEDVVAILNVLFSSFDAMTDKYHVYKVETIGDAYLACSGVVEERADHTKLLVECGLAMRRVTRLFQTPDHSPIVVRVGIHTGFVIAGVVGRKMPRYHLFGETVSIAEEMEQRAPAGHVTVSEATLKAMTEDELKLFDFAPLEPIKVGGNQHRPQAGTLDAAGEGEVRLMPRYIVRSARSAQLQRARQLQAAVIAVKKWRYHKRSKTMSFATAARVAVVAAHNKRLMHHRTSMGDGEFSTVRESVTQGLIEDGDPASSDAGDN